MSPEAIAVNLIGVDVPGYTPGPPAAAFYSLYWPTGGNLEVWEHNDGGTYVSTKVDVANPGDITGGPSISNGLKSSVASFVQFLPVTEVGPVMIIYGGPYLGVLTGDMYFIDILAGTITTHTLLNPGSMDRITPPKPRPGVDRTSEVFWMQVDNVSTQQYFELWKASLSAGPVLLGTGDDVGFALHGGNSRATTDYYANDYGRMNWSGGGLVVEIVAAGPSGMVYIGSDGGFEICTGYRPGTGAFDRQCYAEKHDAGGLDSVFENTTVRGEEPSTWQAYNVSVNAAKDTAFIYTWLNNVPPEGKMYQPLLGTGNEGADTHSPTVVIGKNGAKTADAAFIGSYQYPWA